MVDEYFSDDPDIDVDRIREDFLCIWQKNIIQVDRIRLSNDQAGDYFREDESDGESRRKIWINVQGINSNAYKRIEAGLITPDATLHAFTKYDEDIEEQDVIKIGLFLYRIQGFNKSSFSGQTAFMDFDLKRIDQESS